MNKEWGAFSGLSAAQTRTGLLAMAVPARLLLPGLFATEDGVDLESVGLHESWSSGSFSPEARGPLHCLIISSEFPKPMLRAFPCHMAAPSTDPYTYTLYDWLGCREAHV